MSARDPDRGLLHTESPLCETELDRVTYLSRSFSLPICLRYLVFDNFLVPMMPNYDIDRSACLRFSTSNCSVQNAVRIGKEYITVGATSDTRLHPRYTRYPYQFKVAQATSSEYHAVCTSLKWLPNNVCCTIATGR